MLHSPSKHSKSSSTSSTSHHHHHHHHHRDHHRDHHHSSSSSHGSSSVSKPLPNLSTHIKIQDNSKLLPRYSVALSKPHDECLPLEELDAIQLELETLLSSVSLRYRALKTEYDRLEDRKHQKKSSDKDKPSSPSTSGKRKRDEKKSSKDSSRHSSSQHSSSKHSKIKSSSSHSPAHTNSQHTDTSVAGDTVANLNVNAINALPHTNPKLLLPKNDVPNKFWLSVEPYCMPLKQEDIKLLDDLIDEYTEPLVPSIPELGTHYAMRWSSDDLRDEHDATESKSKSNKRNSHSSSVDDFMKKGHDKMLGDGATGPLTQRLVAALLEEPDRQNDLIVGCNENAMITQDSSDSFTENNASSANRAQGNALTSLLKSGIDIEVRLKNELYDLGIFAQPDLDNDDEVLNEIKRVRTELLAISEYNRNELKLLRTAAKEEMKRLDVKSKLDRIDQDIIEAYKRVLSAKQKRRPLTRHERNEIIRLTEEQKRLSDLLESMPIPGFNFAVGSTSTSSSSSTSKASNA